MRKLILPIFLILTLFVACKDKETTQQSIEKFDIKKFEELTPRSENFISRYAQYNTPYGFVNMYSTDNNYLQWEYYIEQDDIVCLHKTFYKDTLTLEKTGRCIPGSSMPSLDDEPISIWEYFDPKGKKIKEENTDEGYKILWADVRKIAKENNFQIRNIHKDHKNHKWVILPQHDMAAVIFIDGKTGAVTIENLKTE